MDQQQPIINVDNSFKSFEKTPSEELIERRKSIESMQTNNFNANFKNSFQSGSFEQNQPVSEPVHQFTSSQQVDESDDDQLDVPPFLKNF